VHCAREQFVRLPAILAGMLQGDCADPAARQQLERLTAPKRRGVRRGRRITERAARALTRFDGRVEHALGLFATYQLLAG
jgi:hypothetical protein